MSKGKDERLNVKKQSMLKSPVMRESMASPKEGAVWLQWGQQEKMYRNEAKLEHDHKILVVLSNSLFFSQRNGGNIERIQNDIADQCITQVERQV